MELFNVHQAAQKMAVSHHFLYKIAARGQIAYYKVGAALRFSQAQIDEYLAAHEVRRASERRQLKVLAA